MAKPSPKPLNREQMERPRFLPGRPWPLVLAGLLGIIVGVLLQLSPFVLAYLAATTDAVQQTTNALRPHPVAFWGNALFVALLPLLGFWLFAAAILGLGLRPLGQRLLLYWAFAWAGYAVLFGVVRALLINPRLAEAGLQHAQASGVLLAVAFSLALAGLVGLAVTRRAVQAAFAARRSRA